MSSNYVSSLFSLKGDVQKALKGDKIAMFTSIGNASKVIERTAKLTDTTVGKYAAEVVDTFTKAVDGNKFGTVAKGALKVARSGDEIGITLSGIKTLKSDSPARTFIQEACGWAGKFIAKDLILTHGAKLLNIKGIKPVADAVTNFSKNTKGFGQVPAIVGGVTYTWAKTFGKDTGRKIGTFICDALHLPPEVKEENKVKNEKTPRELAHAPLR